MFFKEVIYVLGDSHCAVFDHLNKDKKLRLKFKVKIVPGATALGLANPNSTTNAINEFRLFLKGVNKNKKIVFLLGEVDTGFLIWYRSETYSMSVEEVANVSLYNYISFIKECISMGFKKIYVLSVPLPTITDGQCWGEIANRRKEIQASKKERTSLTLNYNKQLEKELNLLQVSFISLDQFLYENQTGMIREIFLNSDPLDHHLDNENFSIVLKDALYKNRVIRKFPFFK